MPMEDLVLGIILATTKAFPGIISESLLIDVLWIDTAPSES